LTTIFKSNIIIKWNSIFINKNKLKNKIIDKKYMQKFIGVKILNLKKYCGGGKVTLKDISRTHLI